MNPDGPTLEQLDEIAASHLLQGRHDEAIAAMQQGFVQARATGQPRPAVRFAFRLAMSTASHGEPAIAAGWTERAAGLVDELGDECAETGWVVFLQMFGRLGAGDLAEAARCADEATAIGHRHRDADLEAIGRCSQGRVRLYDGRVDEGLACLDDAMVRVLTGELSTVVAGHVYCTAIEGCQEVGDFSRVAQWTSALDRWCAGQPDLLLFTGQCALHRGQLLRQSGAWAAALEEFEQAALRYERIGTTPAVGQTSAEIGDVLRLRGELDRADDAYRRAADLGYDPQPGLALLRAAQGRLPEAAAAIARLLAETTGPVWRCRLLPAAVEVLVAVGDVATARALAAELGELACTDAARARAAHASGLVELADGDPAGALPYLRKAAQQWARIASPHDRARTALLIGRACASLGDDAESRRELAEAHRAFARLGARPEADAVARLLGPSTRPSGLTEREVQVLRLVASGLSNPQVAAKLVLSEKTIARHLSNIFTKIGVSSRTAAAAYAFEHQLI